ncbi:MAG: rRNA maturation RNase YbeY [Planctomycetota bacterium]|jgi:probable rRNA maturation factor
MNHAEPSRRPRSASAAGDDARPPAAEPAEADADPDQPPEPASGPAAAAAPDRTSIEWLDRSGRALDLDLAWVRDRLADAVARAPAVVARIDVSFVHDAQMAGLHEAHCDIPGTTDVLTFVASAPGKPIEVDIAVCVDEARRRAGHGRHAVERELLLYCVHGVLHAAGYDDHEPAAFEAMHRKEDEILEAIGVGPVFRDDRSGHDADRRTAKRDAGPRDR